MFRIGNNVQEISGGSWRKFIEVYMAFCTSCGKQSGTDDRFCKACGAPVATAVQSPPAVVYCQTCGKPSPAGHDFCEACGTSLRGNISAVPAASPVQQATPIQQFAPAQQFPPAQPTVPIPPPVAARRKSYLWLWLTAAFVVVVAIFALVIIPLLAGPNPSDSLDHVRTAYLQHDQASFDKYVDVNSVLSDWTDQGVNVWLKQQNAGAIETAAAQIIAATVKNAYLPGLAQSVDQMVVSGTWPDQSQNGQNDQTTIFVTSFLSSVLRNVATSQLTYQGVQNKSVINDDAELTVNVTSSLSAQPISVRLKMRRDGDHWRVVAVEDLAGLLNQLSPAATP